MSTTHNRISDESPVLWPSSWRTVPLWSMFERVKDVGHPDEDLLSVYREHGVVKRDQRQDNFNKAALDRNIYQLVHPGWLVVNRMKAWQGSVGISPYRGIVSGHYICFRPRHGEDSRFLNWLLRSTPYIAEYAALSRGVRPNQVEIDNEWLRSIRVKLPPLEEQRRIADFLDAETSHIDALIKTRALQCQLLEERWRARLAHEVEQFIGTHGLIPLRRIVRSVEQGWSPQCEDVQASSSQWGVVKTSAVSSGFFKYDQHKRLPSDVAPQARYRINDGDVLLTRGSGSPELVGVAAIARTRGRRLMFSDLLYRVLIDDGWSPEFLVMILGSSPIRGFISLLLRGQSGQTIKLRIEDVKSIEIPPVPVAEQRRIAEALGRELGQIQEVISKLRKSEALLTERRQALITSAVAGQVEVSTP